MEALHAKETLSWQNPDRDNSGYEHTAFMHVHCIVVFLTDYVKYTGKECKDA